MNEYNDLYRPPSGSAQPPDGGTVPPQEQLPPVQPSDWGNSKDDAWKRTYPGQPPKPEQPLNAYQIPPEMTAPRQQSPGEGAFYGDPSAPVGQSAAAQYPMYAPDYQAPHKQEIPEMNRRIYAMAVVAAVLIFLLCVYCIGSDLMKGAIGGTEAGAQNVTVNLTVSQKPALDPDDENVTADGMYTVSGVAELVKPVIVEVYTYNSADRRQSDLAGTGSGIIISEDGYIVTNAHVVDGTAFSVTLDNEESYDAELIGSDHKTDLAVLKIHANDLPAAELGDSDEVYVGEEVVAIGNPAGLTNTVTKGIVSAIGREVRADSTAFRMECIQTDAAISPGNSGGALVNMYGQVIGITSSKYASSYFASSSAYEGLGFAISMNEALPVVKDLMEQGFVSNRFRIGIVLMSTNSAYAAEQFQEKFGAEMPEELESALWIAEINEDCDIANTELRPDDFILTMEGQDVDGYDSVMEVLDGYSGGDTVTAECARWENGKLRYFEITFKLEEDKSGNY